MKQNTIKFQKMCRFFELFQVFCVVRFKNEACTGTGTKNGTCYTSEECDVKGGTKEGSCADGFGVCCTCEILKLFFLRAFIL